MEIDDKLLERFIKMEVTLDSVAKQQTQMSISIEDMKLRYATKEDLEKKMKNIEKFTNWLIFFIAALIVGAVMNQIMK